MFERPWSGPYALIAFCLLLWALSLWFTWHLSSQRQFYADTAHYQSERAASDTNDELQKCLAHSVRADLVQCVQGVVEAKRADRRAEYDLAAQQEMAYWTRWILLSSVIAAGTAIMGAFYVARTLKEMQRTNDIAHQHFLASQRPWVSIDAKIGSDFVFNEKEGRVTIIFKLKNYGLSPATNVQIETELLPGAFVGWKRLEEIHKSARKFPEMKEVGHNIFPGEEFALSINIPLSIDKIKEVKQKYEITSMKEIRTEFISCAIYISPIDNRKYLTDLVMHFCQRSPDNTDRFSLLQITEGVTPMGDLKLVREFGSGQAH